MKRIFLTVSLIVCLTLTAVVGACAATPDGEHSEKESAQSESLKDESDSVDPSDGASDGGSGNHSENNDVDLPEVDF